MKYERGNGAGWHWLKDEPHVYIIAASHRARSHRDWEAYLRDDGKEIDGYAIWVRRYGVTGWKPVTNPDLRKRVILTAWPMVLEE